MLKPITEKNSVPNSDKEDVNPDDNNLLSDLYICNNRKYHFI